MIVNNDISTTKIGIFSVKEKEYIHHICSSESGEYILVACTSVVFILRNYLNDFYTISKIKSPHDGAVILCSWAPETCSKALIFATYGEDKTIAIFMLYKDKAFIDKKSFNLISINDQESYVYSKNNFSLLSRLRDARFPIKGFIFHIDEDISEFQTSRLEGNYENKEKHSIDIINTLHNKLSLITCCDDGYIRIYSSQDQPSFLLWTIQDQLPSHISNVVGCSSISLNSFQSYIRKIKLNLYYFIAVGGYDGTIKIFAKEKKANRVCWSILFSQEINEGNNISVIDLSWSPNYSRKYDVLASIYGRMPNETTFSENILPNKVKIWQWNLGERKEVFQLVLLQTLDLFDTSLPTNICWNTFGNELLITTTHETIRLWKETKYFENFEMQDLMNFSETDNYEQNTIYTGFKKYLRPYINY